MRGKYAACIIFLVGTLTHDIIVNIPISHSQLTQTLIMNHEYAHMEDATLAIEILHYLVMFIEKN